MSIKMNELAQETRVKFQEAIADGRITADEWKNFSKEEQELLSKGLGGKTPTVGDDIVIKTTKKAPEAKKQERAELSWGEIGKQGLKSVGNFFKGMVCDEDGFSLTRTATTLGTAVAFAAVAAIPVVGPAIALTAGAALGGYMVYDGGKKAIEGTKEYYKATTHEEAVAAMEKAMDGGVETAGGIAALFGVRKGYSKVKAAKTQPKHQTIEEAVQNMKKAEVKTSVTREYIQNGEIRTKVDASGNVTEKVTLRGEQGFSKYTVTVENSEAGSQVHIMQYKDGSRMGTLTKANGTKVELTAQEMDAILSKNNITADYKPSRFAGFAQNTKQTSQAPAEAVVRTETAIHTEPTIKRSVSGNCEKRIKVSSEGNPLEKVTIRENQGLTNRIINVENYECGAKVRIMQYKDGTVIGELTKATGEVTEMTAQEIEAVMMKNGISADYKIPRFAGFAQNN